MKVAVIGAGGFLGRSLVTTLVGRGVAVHALARDWRGSGLEDGPLVTRFEGDAADPEVARTTLRGCSVAYLMAYHGMPLMDGADHLVEYDVNLRILNSAISGAEYGGVERLVLLSSGGTVYGETSEPATEDSALNPKSHYGAIKKLSEEMLAQYSAIAGTLGYTVARVANPFGPGQVHAKRKGLIVSAMLKALTGEPVLVHDDGTQVRDYIYSDDVVHALLALATSPEAVDSVFNVGSGRGRSVADVLSDVERVAGRQFERKHVRGRQQDVDANVLDVEKLHKVVGTLEEVGYETGLERTWDAVRRSAAAVRDLT